MEGTINIHKSRIIPVVEIRNEQEIVQTLNILTNGEGEFSVPVDILDTWVDGSYTATILSGEFEITSTTFMVNKLDDVEPEILEEIPDQIIGEIFISDKDVTQLASQTFPELPTINTGTPTQMYSICPSDGISRHVVQKCKAKNISW